MNIKDAFTFIPDTGNCTMDVDKAVKLFDSKCFILRWHQEYRMIRAPRKNPNFKVTIDSQDAKTLIKKLDLQECVSQVFRDASTFRLEG